MRKIVALDSVFAVIVLTGGTSLHAQVAAPVFEVASVKPHVQGSGLLFHSCKNERYVSMGDPLVDIIDWAYDLNTDQYRQVEEHLPKWMSPTTAYDIEAKAESPVTESQCRLAMQALLADRFKFAAHWESKEAQVSDLVVARGGPKLERASETDKGTDVSISLNGRPLPTGARAGQLKGMTIEELAGFLTSGMRQQPIIDKTGIDGRYKIELKFSLQPAGADQQFDDPDLDTALQLQLGLKLERHKGSVKLLIVDRIEPPSPN
jgi:uncharacterized protein (TIGR03435 family)